ncbi:hypothetical protein D3260_14375 [Salinisphaera sp. Q1T1-3]|nr:hypothetical protein D3260_14375 [Salinisphaera sp. Q1T1-3]
MPISLLCLLLTAAAHAETRALNKDLERTDETPAYRLHWPLKKTDSGWEAIVDRPDGTPYLRCRIVDPNARPMLADDNRRGPVTFYYDNGQVRQTGQYGDGGRLIGKARTYRNDGSLRDVRRYTPAGYRLIKAFNADGSVALESLPDKGVRTERQKRYREDGSLMRQTHVEPDDNGDPMEVARRYDRQGELTERQEIHKTVQFTETLTDGHVVERQTFSRPEAWSITERFDENGRLIKRDRRLLPDFVEDGEQIFTTRDGVRRVSHYRQGKKHGLETGKRGGTWLHRIRYRNDHPVGLGFDVDPESGEVTFTRYDDTGKYLSRYDVEADLITHDADGKPSLPDAWATVRRTLPAPGTTWLYQFNDRHPVRLRLQTVKNGVARYDVADGQSVREESVARYQPMDAAGGPMLRFPLHPGDRWEYETERVIHVPADDGARWQYRYRTHVVSRVTAVETIRVGAGTFKALRIRRGISWFKDRPSGEGARFDRIEKNDDGTVKGFTQELLWYAPKAGRVVLKTHVASGLANVLDRPAADQLTNVATWFTELVGLAGPGESPSPASPQYARAPQARWIGFPMQRNNTWEYLMQSHSPSE